MADSDFYKLLSQLLARNLDTEDPASLRRHISSIESLPKHQLKASVSAFSPEQRTEFTSLCSRLLLKNAVDLEGFFANSVIDSPVAVDCVPALLWVLLAGDTKRFIEPLVTVFYYALRDGPGKNVRVPLGSEDREIIIVTLIKTYGKRPDERLQDSNEMMYELLARLNSGVPRRPGESDRRVHPNVSSAVLNAALFTVLRLRPAPDRLRTVFEGIEAYALRRMFADTLLTIQAVRTINTESIPA